MMTVVFFGTEESLTSWKALVEKTTGKKCGAVHLGNYNSHRFIAPINNKDCETLMKHWYLKDREHHLPWNMRISFRKVRL